MGGCDRKEGFKNMVLQRTGIINGRTMSPREAAHISALDQLWRVQLIEQLQEYIADKIMSFKIIPKPHRWPIALSRRVASAYDGRLSYMECHIA